MLCLIVVVVVVATVDFSCDNNVLSYIVANSDLIKLRIMGFSLTWA